MAHGFGPFPAEVGVKIGKEIHKVLGLHPAGVVHPIRQIADQRLGLRTNVLPVDLHFTLRRAEQTGENLDKCGLAGAVGTKQTDDLARRQLQVHLVQRRDSAAV